MLDDLSIDELKLQIIESEDILKELDKKISLLTGILQKKGKSDDYVSIRRIYQNIIRNKYIFEREHRNNTKYIQEYKLQLKDIQKKVQSQNNLMDALKKENKELKARIRKNSENRSPRKKIRGVSDLRKSFGFNLKKIRNDNKKQNKGEDDEINEEKNEDGDISGKGDEFEKLKKAKKDSEAIFHKLQEAINSYYKDTDKQITYITNYRCYIDSINNQISSFRQQLRVSIVGEAQYNFLDKSSATLKQLTKDMELITNIINQVNDNIYVIKNRTLKRGENILERIQTKLNEINRNKNLTFGFLSYRMDYIENQIDNLKQLCQTLKDKLYEILNQRKQIETNIGNLKADIQKFMDNYIEGRKRISDAIRKTLRKTGKNIFSSINKSLRDEKNDKDDEKNDEICDDIAEEEIEEEGDENLNRASTLIKINDFSKNKDLFQSIVLFQNKNENEENRIKEAKILRKNWNEVCYIYDDYDIHDINFEIKAVGLSPFSFFNSCSNGFYMGKDIEIIELEINGKSSKYTYDNYCLEYNISLKNLETANIHLKYKERPKFNSMPQNEKTRYKFFRQEYYGLSESLAGQIGKFRLILRGSFEIVSFSEDFLIKNEKNKIDKEYIWGGKIPLGGKRTLAKLSKNEANWKIYCNTQIISKRGNLKNTTLKVPMGFAGGNNDIIKMDYSSPQTQNIEVDEENRVYEIRYKNTSYQKGDFILTGEIKNRCKGEWEVDLSDEIIEKNIPYEDKKDKKMLEKIARNIIAEFDRNNKDNIFVFMDFTKIGKWVNKNIKYDLNYSGRTEMTAMDIYKKRVGVCHHMTRLANALLYSLGYKVIYTNGFACESSDEFDQNSAHAWSLINVDGNWYPFDATWDILSGKLPVCHIFQGFFGQSIILFGSDGAIFGKNNTETGKYLK